MNELMSMNEIEKAAGAMSKSGFFKDTAQVAQAIVKILAGQELGFGAFSSMTGVHIIQGKPVLSANLIAAAIKRTGKYNYRIATHTDTECSIDFYEGAEKVGNSTFTLQDAKRAGISNQNWQKYPRNMLFARAISNGQKWYAPDIFNGATVYTPDELGANVDDEGNIEGNIVDAKFSKERKPTRQLLLDAYTERCRQANELGIATKTITPETPDDVIITLGKELKALIEAAEKAQEQKGQ